MTTASGRRLAPHGSAPGAPFLAQHIPYTDWTALFDAVLMRLRMVAGSQLQAECDPQLHALASGIQTGVLDCVQALEQLQRMLAPPASRLAHLQDALRDAEDRAQRLGADLAGARAAGRRERHRAQHDELTALPNRSFFHERLDRALAAPDGPRHLPAVLYLDLDGFKPINDRHGHDVGDELLRIVALRLARAMRSEDVVSRIGGDEFACLLAEAGSRDQLGHVACKLFDAVSTPLKIGDLQLCVRASIGIAVAPTDGSTAGVLMKHADAAMYHAKREQTGYAFFDRCPSS
ncbi:diguanylate cyclase domain-containing protein [Rubrivivax sp. RP6-9]|uniref:diguanylate cyclase domain-containing protein n=1 Tax=Rubrivivax sp. RP6-9 TaxID=3415750 RepID=UPI003CC52F0B